MEPTTQSTAAKVAVNLLRECLTDKMHKNPSYSARAFARDIQVSPAFISMVLAGKKKLSLERAQKVSLALEMPERKRDHFLRAVALASLPKTGTLTHEMENILFGRTDRKDIYSLDVDKFKFFRNWYHIAVLDLTTCSDFKPEVSWIAARLGISQLMARDTIERLLRLGLLKEERGTFVKTNAHITVPTTGPEGAVQDFHRQMMEKAKEELNSHEADAFRKRDISSLTMSIDPEKIEEAKRRIAEFKAQLGDLLTQGECTEVYQVNIQFFPLTKRKQGA
jgi:uncharacterized protein (TIGR02147 family)